MKLVINGCFGGFGMSAKAEDLYAEKAGFSLYRYKQTKYRHNGGTDLFERDDDGDSFCCFSFKKDQGDSFTAWPDSKESGYWDSSDVERDDEILIAVVEELGEQASGSCSSLEVVEIPDGVSWEIEEYDGNEHVSESHRTWG